MTKAEMKVKRATASDLLRIATAVDAFLGDTEWPLTYDHEATLQTLQAYLQNDDTEVIYAEIDGIVVGFALVAWDSDFYKERVGYIGKFYISAAGRKTGISRQTLTACTAWFDYNGCALSFVTDTAAIRTQGKLFNNLMKKHGYKPCGDTLVRGKNEQT